jgi:hypothetical protein
MYYINHQKLLYPPPTDDHLNSTHGVEGTSIKEQLSLRWTVDLILNTDSGNCTNSSLRLVPSLQATSGFLYPFQSAAHVTKD